MTTLTEALDTKTEAENLEAFLVEATALGMPTGGWDEVRLPRTVFQIEAKSHTEWQALREKIVAGGLLDLAAALRKEDGTEEHYYLDKLGEGFFDTRRVAARATIGTVRLTDSASVGPFTISTVLERIAKAPGANQLYRNTTTPVVIPLNSFVDATFKADVAGAAGNVANGAIDRLVNAIPGITVANPAVGATGTWITTAGRDAETNATYLARLKSRWGTLGAGGVASAIAWHITDAAPTITRYYIDDANPNGPGSVDVWIANATGPATVGEVAAVDARLQAKRPKGTGPRRTFSATQLSQAVTGVVYATGNPDAATQASAAITALQSTAMLSGTFYRDAILDVVLDLAGVYKFELATPAADITTTTQALVFTPINITLG